MELWVLKSQKTHDFSSCSFFNIAFWLYKRHKMAKKKAGRTLSLVLFDLFPSPTISILLCTFTTRTCLRCAATTDDSFSLSLDLQCGGVAFCCCMIISVRKLPWHKVCKGVRRAASSVRSSVCLFIMKLPLLWFVAFSDFSLRHYHPDSLFVCLLFCIMRKYPRFFSACTTRLEERKRD